MNSKEKELLELLSRGWNLFLSLPELHPNDQQEFMQSIHAAQNIILARSQLREFSNKPIMTEDECDKIFGKENKEGLIF